MEAVGIGWTGRQMLEGRWWGRGRQTAAECGEGVSRFVSHKFRIIVRVSVHRFSCISVNKKAAAVKKNKQ